MHKRKEPLPLRKKLLSDHVGDLYTALLIAGGLLLLIMAVLPSSVQNVTVLMLRGDIHCLFLIDLVCEPCYN